MQPFQYKAWISLLALLLLTSLSSRRAQSDGPPLDQTAPSAAPPQTAYMDLSLTVHDEYGGELSVDEAFSLSFRSDATDGWDRYDASKLLPRGETWAAIAFTGTKNGDETLKAQESRPYEDSVHVVDITVIQKNMPAAQYTIDAQRWDDVPAHWSLRLRVQQLDTTLVVDAADATVSFRLGASDENTSKSSSDTTHVPVSGEVGPRGTALPVEFASFTATRRDRDVHLVWETASETNNSGFVVQHRRADTEPESWQRIGFVEGAGTTDRPQQYRFTRSSLSPGIHEFRLKQIDTDGTTHPTAARRLAIRPETTVDLTTAPNPFTDRMTVTLTTRSSQPITVQLVDMLGRVVREHGPVQVPANRRTRTQLDGGRLSAGSYLLRVDGETFSATRRVVHVR